jgi:large subunit ribosomal protein L25
MKLKMIKRTAEKKTETKKLRREGYIPAVIYGKKADGENIAISSVELGAILRKIVPGRLSTAIFTLSEEKGKGRRAIIKDIQYNVTNYDVIHVDFEELSDETPVNLNVPIECIGAAEAPGVKLGGVLRQVIRQVRIRALPRDIPEYFELDVRDLNPQQSKKLSDISMPETIRPMEDMNKVVATVVKR